MKIPLLFRYCLLIVMTSLLSSLSCFASANPNDEDFVRVSIVSVSPGNAPYSAAGHTALRLECPSANLDYCFSYEMTLGFDEILKFLAGKADAGYLAADFKDYVSQYDGSGRGIIQYQVNLTPQQERELWRYLDSEIVKQMPYRYDYVHNMCSTMAFEAIKTVLGDERIIYGALPDVVVGSSRDAMLYGLRNAPWATFFWQTIMGTDAERNPVIEQNMCPELLVASLKNASIRDVNNHTRPFFAEEEILIKEEQTPPTIFSPIVCFGLLLVIAFVLTFLQIKNNARLAARIFDILLFTTTSIIGLILTWMLLFSTLVATDWNWYIIPFNPVIPLLIILWRNKRTSLWRIYTAILLLCCIAVPFIPQFDIPHMLVFMAMAIRTLYNSKINLSKSVQR